MSCFFFLRLLYNAFNPPARANCIGIAGVNGADQNTIIADTAVQYQGLTIHASNTQTITGNQNMNSAKSIQINISLVKTLVKTVVSSGQLMACRKNMAMIVYSTRRWLNPALSAWPKGWR